jgi:hypothetical protein
MIVENNTNSLKAQVSSLKIWRSFQTEMESLLTSETTLNVDTIAFEDLGLETIKLKDLLKIDFIFS